MTDLDDSFAKLLGLQPSEAEKQHLHQVKTALGLRNNDALWLLLIALEHYHHLGSVLKVLLGCNKQLI